MLKSIVWIFTFFIFGALRPTLYLENFSKIYLKKKEGCFSTPANSTIFFEIFCSIHKILFFTFITANLNITNKPNEKEFRYDDLANCENQCELCKEFFQNSCHFHFLDIVLINLVVPFLRKKNGTVPI